MASNEALSRTFGEGFDAVNGTLEWGFGRLDAGLSQIEYAIEDLRADFNYSMGLLLAAIDTQNQLLSSLLEKLDAVHKTLENPLLTQARELYRIGCDRLSKGLLDKALESFAEAEAKSDTDVFTQYHIGNLYLYGVNEDCNVIELPKAKQYFLNAARYARAEMTVDSSFGKLAAQAYLNASISNYALIGEGEPESLAEEARDLALRAVELSPEFSEAHYHVAKYSALLGDSERSIESLGKAIRIDRNYAVKVDDDLVFDSVRGHVFAFMDRLRADAERAASQKLEVAKQELEETEQWKPEEYDDFTKAKGHFKKAQNLYTSETYFDLLDAIPLFVKVADVAVAVRLRWINYLRHEIDQNCPSSEDRLSIRNRYGHSIEISQTLDGMGELILKIGDSSNAKTPDSLFQAVDISEKVKEKNNTLEKLIEEENQRLREEERIKRELIEEENQRLREEERIKRELKALQEKREEQSRMGMMMGGWIGGLCGFLSGCGYGFYTFDEYGNHDLLYPLKTAFMGGLFSALGIGILGAILGWVLCKRD